MVWVFACDDPLPPVACGNIPQQTVTVHQEVVLAPCFEDPEMGELTLAAVSSNPEVATGEMSGDKVRIAGVSPGTATITVTATDLDMMTGELNFDVLVPNRPPELRGELPSARMHPGGPPVRLVLSEYFADPDGQELTYGATSSDTAVASVALLADTLAVAGGSDGEATVTVTATDPGGLSATARMEVLVGRPPVVLEELPLDTVSAGDTALWVLSEYFSDPDGDQLTYGAESSDRTIAQVALWTDTLIVRGRSGGTATVTVTATDPSGLSATSKMEVVVQGGRPPVVLKEILPGMTMPKRIVFRQLRDHFSDPDDEPLTYSATVSDSTVASVSISSFVTVVGMSAGRVTVTVTATDPGGLSATAKWDVRVVDQALPFRDDFDSVASLEHWEVQEFTTADIGNGKLRLTNINGKRWAFVRRPFWATDWTVKARMGNLTEDSWVQLVIGTDTDPRYYYFLVGEDPNGRWKLNGRPIGGNWRLFADRRGRLTYIAHGSSEAVAPVGELMDVSLSVEDDTLSVVIGDEEVFSSAVYGGFNNVMTNLWLAVWPLPGTTGKAGVFEWLEVTGLPYSHRVARYGDANFAHARTGEFLGSARLPTVIERPSQPVEDPPRRTPTPGRRPGTERQVP